jgi:glutaredoxin 3
VLVTSAAALAAAHVVEIVMSDVLAAADGPGVVIYKTQRCPYCVAASRYLREVKGVEPIEIDLTRDMDARMALKEKTGSRTVPQIFISGQHIGGYDDLRALERQGGLDPLLADEA